MRTQYKIAIQVILALAVGAWTTSCSHVKRSKYSDPHMRVAVWPVGIDAGNHVRIQQALVATGKFIVVDRGAGLAAIEKEQEALHETQSDRFADAEKFAHWGKLLGVGAVVVAHTQCADKHAWIVNSMYARCQQFVEIVNSNTGEVMASAEGQEDTANNEQELAPSWESTVDRLVDAYPSHYEPNRDTAELVDYKALSKEEATRQKEARAKKVSEDK